MLIDAQDELREVTLSVLLRFLFSRFIQARHQLQARIELHQVAMKESQLKLNQSSSHAQTLSIENASLQR